MEVVDFETLRSRTGFVAIFALLAPCAFTTTNIDGELVPVFISLLGVVAAIVTFDGFTFDFYIQSINAGMGLQYWIYGIALIMIDLFTLKYLSMYSMGTKNEDNMKRVVIFTALLSLLVLPLFIIPIPFVSLIVYLRVKSIPRKLDIPSPNTDITTSITSTEDASDDLDIAQRLPKFLIHGSLIAAIDFAYTMIVPVFSVSVFSTFLAIGLGSSLIYIAILYGFMFMGLGFINAWAAERVWGIDWDYGIISITFIGFLLFMLSTLMVSPLSMIANMYLGSSYLAIAIILIYRYTAVSFVIGIAGWTISHLLKLRPRGPEPLLVPITGPDGRFHREIPEKNDEESEI